MLAEETAEGIFTRFSVEFDLIHSYSSVYQFVFKYGNKETTMTGSWYHCDERLN